MWQVVVLAGYFLVCWFSPCLATSCALLAVVSVIIRTLPAVIRGDAAFTTMWSGSFDLSHATMATAVSSLQTEYYRFFKSLVLIHLLMKYKVHDSISARG